MTDQQTDQPAEPDHARITGDDRDLRRYSAGAFGLTGPGAPTRAVWPEAVTASTGDRL